MNVLRSNLGRRSLGFDPSSITPWLDVAAKTAETTLTVAERAKALKESETRKKKKKKKKQKAAEIPVAEAPTPPTPPAMPPWALPVGLALLGVVGVWLASGRRPGAPAPAPASLSRREGVR